MSERWRSFLDLLCEMAPDYTLDLGRTIITDCPQKSILVDGKRSTVRVDSWELEDCNGDETQLRRYANKLLDKMGLLEPDLA